MKTTSFVVACNTYFGRKPGQTIGDFQAELKALTPKDRADLIAMFPSVGYTITEPQGINS